MFSRTAQLDSASFPQRAVYTLILLLLLLAAVALAGPAPVAARDGLSIRQCENLQVPQGSKVAARMYASGVQVYRWNGTSWTFVAPEAVLTANAGGQGTIGTHYAGPTWESNSGSKVIGAVLERCTPDANAIPWLLLEAVHSTGPGIFRGITFIQRVNTVGGKAPETPGAYVNEVSRVAYTTEYIFYR